MADISDDILDFPAALDQIFYGDLAKAVETLAVFEQDIFSEHGIVQSLI